MIGLLGDPHSGFAMSDGLLEPTEVGKRGAKHVLRRCRCDRGRSETLSAQLAVKSDVPFEQFYCFAVLAPYAVCVGKIERCDHLDGAIAEGARDGERLLPEFESCIMVARGSPLLDHEGGDPPEPMLIAKRPREHLRLVKVVSHVRPIAERKKCVAQVDADVNG